MQMRSENSWPGALAEDWRHGGFGLYVHWPFCTSKCPYCDFNSHVSSHVDHDVWREAYRRELLRLAEETPGRVLNSIYFGGGTPSLMSPGTVAQVIETAKSCWRQANSLEVTLEANPGSVERARFAGFHDAGVNRVSLGVQALNDPDLKRLGRLHTVADSLQAIDIANETFDRVSFDLIYARQDQSLEDWQAELMNALMLQTGHMSLYQLTIEEGTAFGDRFRLGKMPGLPDETLSADLFELTRDLCQAAGLQAYEVSNFARPGEESRHNLVYWNSGDYIGIGPGAHGRMTLDGARFATIAPASPSDWLNRVKAGSGELSRERLRPLAHGAEMLMMGLRLRDGFAPERYQEATGRQVDSEAVEELVEMGMLHHDCTIRATDKGRMVLNAVVERLLRYQ